MTNPQSEQEKARKRQRIVKGLSMITQVSLTVACPIILLLLVGNWLDEKYGGGQHWFALAGIVLGLYSAYRNTYYLLKDTFGLGQKDGEKKQKETPDPNLEDDGDRQKEVPDPNLEDDGEQKEEKTKA